MSLISIFRRTPAANDPFDGIALGDRAEDTISGFTGIVVGRNETLTGCAQVCLAPRGDKPHQFVEPNWFDVERVTLLGRAAAEIIDRPSGGDIPLPPTTGRRA